MAAGESGVRWVERQLIAALFGPLIVQDMEPAGVKPAVPVTTTVKVVVPPKVAAELVIALIVGTKVEIPMVTWLEAAGV